MKNLRLGEILIQSGKLSQEQLDEALAAQKGTGKRLGETLVSLGYISEMDMLKALSQRLMVPILDLGRVHINIDAVRRLPEAAARRYHAVPIDEENGVLTVALTDPLDLYAIEDIKALCSREIDTVLATRRDVDTIIDRYYSENRLHSAMADVDREFVAEDAAEAAELLAANERVDNAPVVKLVNSIIVQAYNMNASDIHIEPVGERTVIRFRIDGDLTEHMNSSITAHNSIVTRVKIMAGMNIAEKRLPQDGRFEFDMAREQVDIRVSSLPTTRGEKLVLRLLGSRRANIRRVDDLGMSDKNRRMFDSLIRCANGILLVTGPTGSGKSTTLYAVLQQLQRPTVNIVTVEDPVEMEIPGISQVQVNQKAGLTFASGLRSILRQDPDIIMIGEIRDAETAEIAIRAAITGHLVLSTLHTNDAASAPARLIDMGVEPFLVASSLNGVMAQRLVKLNCPHCAEEYTSTPEEMALMGLDEPVRLKRSVGCTHCSFTGHRGRAAIHELVLVDSRLRTMITEKRTADELRSYAVEHGTVLLREDMREMVLAGRTTVDEMIKATYTVD